MNQKTMLAGKQPHWMEGKAVSLKRGLLGLYFVHAAKTTSIPRCRPRHVSTFLGQTVMGPFDATCTQVVHLSPNIKSMSQNQNRMICRQARELTILTVKFEVRARKITTELKTSLSQNLSNSRNTVSHYAFRIIYRPRGKVLRWRAHQ